MHASQNLWFQYLGLNFVFSWLLSGRKRSTSWQSSTMGRSLCSITSLLRRRTTWCRWPGRVHPCLRALACCLLQQLQLLTLLTALRSQLRRFLWSVPRRMQQVISPRLVHMYLSSGWPISSVCSLFLKRMCCRYTPGSKGVSSPVPWEEKGSVGFSCC